MTVKKPHAGGNATRRFATAIAAVAAVLIVIGIAVVPRLLETASETASIGGPFTLVDQTGRTVTDKDFRGKLMLVYFGYTYCPDVCPTTLGAVSQAYDQLAPADKAKVVPIFITVDPERDTVNQMAQYVGNFSPALVGLTGSPQQIQKVLQEYRVYARKAEPNGTNYSVDHSSILYLMGKDGKFVAHFSGSATADEIAAGLKKQLAG